ncbi:MAG: hypothetical protein JSV23_02725 [Promethearchaeota archaeon]|nr:MAG: hypothetical protein JSV23_02725 [Candidatus Lokiarchaeota archaeon]
MSRKKKKNALRFFNEAVEYIDRYDTRDILIEETTIPLNIRSPNSNFLRDEMLNELNNLRNIIRDNPDLKIEKLSDEEKEIFYDFIKFYRICPLCGNPNHFFNLKKVFFDENKKILIKQLIRLMTLKSNKLKNYHLHLGVPCCNCYKNLIK